MYLVGWIRFQQGKYNEAVDNFKFLIKAYSSSGLVARSHYTIGDAYYNRGNYDGAIESYKTVVELFPSSDLAPEAMKSMQQCLLILGRESFIPPMKPRILISTINSSILLMNTQRSKRLTRVPRLHAHTSERHGLLGVIFQVATDA